jgi:phenylacetate-CoA ligase
MFPYSVRKSLNHICFRIALENGGRREYSKLMEFLSRAQWWDRERIAAWQLGKLRGIVRWAYDKVPGYRDLYQEAGVKPEDIRSLQDVALLPFTTKDLLRDNHKDFIARDIPAWKRRRVTTGGSSGEPLGFYQSTVNAWMERAFIHSSWHWAGWRPQDRRAILRGAFSGSAEKVGRFYPLRQELLLSSYHLTSRTYASYRALLRKYSPPFLHAYPSTATLLADLVLENRDEAAISFKGILLGSENIQDWQREKMLAAFPGARVFGWYGHSEQAILASACESSDQYHAWPFYGLTEIIDKNGRAVAENGSGELIGTSFWSDATPFIRYRTEDLARRGADRCPKCSRNFPLIDRIEGRKQEYVIAADGGRVTLTALIFAQHFPAFTRIRSMQLQQDRAGEILVRVVPAGGFSRSDAMEIERKIASVSGGKLRARVQVIEELSLTLRGKHRFLVQNMGTRS